MVMEGSWKIHGALALVQVNYGGYHVLSQIALNAGINELVFCSLRDLLALAVLLPLAFFAERRARPPLNFQLVLSFLFLGLTGIFATQLLFLIGLGLTSATYAAAMQPSIPVFTFVLAVLMGTERVNLFQRDGKAKLGGVVLCISGAFLMALYKGPSIWGVDNTDEVVLREHSFSESLGWLKEGLSSVGLNLWQIGILCLVGNCFCMALYLAVQAPVLARYPASLSLTAYSYVAGAGLMICSGLVGANQLSDWILTRNEVLAVVYAGLIASALNYTLYTWANKNVGPTIVALYNPLQPLACDILSRLFLGTNLYLGSVLGGGFIVAGLYCVTWGQREAQRLSNADAFITPISESEESAPELKASLLVKVVKS